MTYREQAKKAYIESLKSYGANEATIRIGLMAFDTGFMVGTYINEDEEKQLQMLESLIREPNIN